MNGLADRNVGTSNGRLGLPHEVNQRLLTVRQAAEYLGLKPSTLYDWVARHKISFVKLNGALRFDLRDLERMIENARCADV